VKKDSAMSSVGSPHEASQSGHGSDPGIYTSTSCQNHDGGGGAGLRDEPTTNNDSLKKHMMQPQANHPC